MRSFIFINIFIYIFGFTFYLSAQTLPTIKIYVRDSVGQPVSDAAAVLMSLPDSVIINGALTDDMGIAKLERRKNADFLRVTAIGWQPFYKNLLSEDTVIQVVLRTAPELILAGVEIAARVGSPLIRQEPDRTVMNVEQSLTVTGLSVADVLKRAPGVTVDQNGTPDLKGKDDVLILIDDKPVYMDEAQIGALLKSLPADRVKEIELITNPSAKYDAQGSAGIINIRLKKGANDGISGSLNAGYGQGFYPKAFTGGNIDIKKNKWSFNAGTQYNYRVGFSRWNNSRTETGQPFFAVRNRFFYKEPENNVQFNTSLGFRLSERTEFKWTGIGNITNFNSTGDTRTDFMTAPQVVDTFFRSEDRLRKRNHTLGGELSFKYIFDSLGTELSLSAGFNQYTGSDRQSMTVFRTLPESAISLPAFGINNIYSVHYPTLTLQADFSKKVFKNYKLDVGLKRISIFYRTDRDLRIRNLETPGKNTFEYDEHISAGYVVFSTFQKNWRIKAGLRAEHTLSDGQTGDRSVFIRRDYLRFFPSFSASYEKSKKVTPFFNYSYKLDRPDYIDLNPFGSFGDPFTGIRGNPNLMPQFAHNLEGGILIFEGAFGIVLNYNHTSALIADLYAVNGGQVAYTKFNVGRMINYGLALTADVPLQKWWTVSAYIYGYENRFRGDIGQGVFENNRLSFMANLTNSFKINPKTSAELTSNFLSPNAWGNMVYFSMGELSFGVRRKILKDKASLNLSVNDAFWTYNWIGEGKTGTVRIDDDFRWDNRTVILSFQYRFAPKIGTDSEKSVIEKIEKGRR